MQSDRKYCAMCGRLISDLSDERTDYYRHIALKYCPICAKTAERMHLNARVKAWRARKRQKEQYRDEQLELLRTENELLRARIAELRRD